MPVVATPGLQSLGTAPIGPGQLQLRRAGRQRQGDGQQAPHFRDRQIGQEELRPPFFSVAMRRTEANQA